MYASFEKGQYVFAYCCFALLTLTSGMASASQADLARGILLDLSYGAEPREDYQYNLRYEQVPASANLENGSEYWYKVTKCKDPSVWVAFTVGPNSSCYVMYADIDGKIQPYSKRYFIYSLGSRPIGIQVESLNDGFGAGSGSYFPSYDGTHLCYFNKMTNEYSEDYVTAAMEEVRDELED